MNPCSFDEPLQFLALPFAIDFFLFGEIIILANCENSEIRFAFVVWLPILAYTGGFQPSVSTYRTNVLHERPR